MKNIVYKLVKAYDIFLTILFVLLILFTGFVIVYYSVPDSTSEIIAKALSYINNEEIATKIMDYINGFTIGAGFPFLISQKTQVAHWLSSIQNKYGTLNTKELLAENLSLQEIQIEFQKAEAERFVNSPVMPAKARLHYKTFLDKLEERNQHIEELKKQADTKVVKEKVKKVIKKKVEEIKQDSTDALI